DPLWNPFPWVTQSHAFPEAACGGRATQDSNPPLAGSARRRFGGSGYTETALPPRCPTSRVRQIPRPESCKGSLGQWLCPAGHPTAESPANERLRPSLWPGEPVARTTKPAVPLTPSVARYPGRSPPEVVLALRLPAKPILATQDKCSSRNDAEAD